MRDTTMDYNEQGQCNLCGEDYYHYGNNPRPVLPNFEQRVCDSCNSTVVIPARLGLMFTKRPNKPADRNS